MGSTPAAAADARKQEAALKRLAQRNFSDFVRYTFPNFRENWHHTLIMGAIDRSIKFQPGWEKVIIVTPPRHGKSELVSRRLPAYVMGRYPELEVLMGTYSDDLGQKMGRDVGKIIKSAEYREVFPYFEFGSKNTHTEMDTAEGGTFKAGGVGSGFTGRGGNVVIVDDPIKNRQEAEQQATRDRIWDWFQDDLMTRLEYPYSVIVTHTRWHEDDLIGRLLEREPGEWKVIHLPLIADYDDYPEEGWPAYDPRKSGEVLWPEVRLKGRINDPNIRIPTREELTAEILKTYASQVKSNPYGTFSLQQGRPRSKEGKLIKKEWIHTYSAPPEILVDYCDSVYISIDANLRETSKGSAAAIVVVGRYKNGALAVLDATWGRWGYSDLKAQMKRMASRWPKGTLLIEAKANGDALIDEMRKEGRLVIPFEPGNNSKEVRGQRLADFAQGGQLMMPDHAPWVRELTQILVDFPGPSIDDPFDALAQAAHQIGVRGDPLSGIRRTIGHMEAAFGGARDAFSGLFGF